MEVRGTRECRSCGERWSYYDTGSVECPHCGSLHSVGVEDERRLHTASPADLDLTAARTAVDDGAPRREVAARVEDAVGPFVRRHGFVDAGAFQPLTDTYLAAVELREVADSYGRAARVSDAEKRYLLALLRGADAGERPASEEIPDACADSRGLAYAEAIDAYLGDLRACLKGGPDDLLAGPLARLEQHQRRATALQGDVPPQEAERLVAAARGIGRYVADDDETALADAVDRLDRLG